MHTCVTHSTQHLLSQDHFLNAANWQWLSASAFFNQYYRVYSPVTFGKKYDPNGNFIKKFLPQVGSVNLFSICSLCNAKPLVCDS